MRDIGIFTILSSQNLHRLDCELRRISKSSEQKKKEKIKEKTGNFFKEKDTGIFLKEKTGNLFKEKDTGNFLKEKDTGILLCSFGEYSLKNHHFSEKFRAPPFSATKFTAF